MGFERMEPVSAEAVAGSDAEASRMRRDQTLRTRPGFLIRRLHQIHTALFIEECGEVDITPVQFSFLTVLEDGLEREQAHIASLLGIDRTNAGDVASRLEKRGLIDRRINPLDKRHRLLRISGAGMDLLSLVKGPAQRAHDRTVAALSAGERDVFMNALNRLVDAGDALDRAPPRLR